MSASQSIFYPKKRNLLPFDRSWTRSQQQDLYQFRRCRPSGLLDAIHPGHCAKVVMSMEAKHSKHSGKLTHPLKLVIETWKFPEASATTAFDVSIAERACPPHGLLALGRCTLLRAGVPATPKAGAMAAWAVTCTAPNATMSVDRKTLTSIMIEKLQQIRNEKIVWLDRIRDKD